jgi:tRNA(Ile)-lysidine synthase
VRHELLPLLSSFNPRFGEALIRTAERISEDEDYLSRVAAELAEAASDGPTIEIRPLRELHPALRRRALRAWLRNVRGDLRRIDAAHLMALDALVTARPGGRYIELPGGWQVHRQFKRLILVRAGDANAPARAPGQCQRIRSSRIVETAD